MESHVSAVFGMWPGRSTGDCSAHGTATGKTNRANRGQTQRGQNSQTAPQTFILSVSNIVKYSFSKLLMEAIHVCVSKWGRFFKKVWIARHRSTEGLRTKGTELGCSAALGIDSCRFKAHKEVATPCGLQTQRKSADKPSYLDREAALVCLACGNMSSRRNYNSRPEFHLS